MAKQQSNKKAKTRSESSATEHSWARHGRYEGKCSVAGCNCYIAPQLHLTGLGAQF